MTQLTDEADLELPGNVITLLDRALGPEGYYGAFTTNMHTDQPVTDATAIVSAAQARGVPVVSARQMLQWLDGRNSSSFSSLDLTGDSMQFHVSAALEARNLEVMLPAQLSGKPITVVRFEEVPIRFRIENIKGIDYVIFPALTGAYELATEPQLPDTERPTVSLASPEAGAVISGTNVVEAFTISADICRAARPGDRQPPELYST